MVFKVRGSDIYQVGAIAAGVGVVGIGLGIAVASQSLRMQVEKAGWMRGEYRKAARELARYPENASAPRALEEKVRRLEADSTRMDADMQEKLTEHVQKQFGVRADGSPVTIDDLPKVAQAIQAESDKYQRMYADACDRASGVRSR